MPTAALKPREHLTMPSPKSTKQLLVELEQSKRRLEDAREAIIQEIRRRMGDVTPYQFAAASGINRGNLYNLVSNGKWNEAVAVQALDLLSTPLRDKEIESAKRRLGTDLGDNDA